MARLAWHSAFSVALQFELAAYLKYLIIETEHQLTTGPLKIDVLIIKKLHDIFIDKNIGRIFRTHNIVEFKSPRKTATVMDFFKTLVYGFEYVVLEKVMPAEISLTLVIAHQAKGLFKVLRELFSVRQVEAGIYWVEGAIIPVQIIVSQELSESENLWLRDLNFQLTQEQARRVIEAAEKCAEEQARVYLDVVMDANYVAFTGESMGQLLERRLRKDGFIDKWTAGSRAEGRVEGRVEGRAEGIAEGHANGIAEGIAKGHANGIAEMVRKMLLNGMQLEEIAKITGFSATEIQNLR
jgi:hypothetical protein